MSTDPLKQHPKGDPVPDLLIIVRSPREAATKVGEMLSYHQGLSLDGDLGRGVTTVARGRSIEHFSLFDVEREAQSSIRFSKKIQHGLEVFLGTRKDGAVALGGDRR